MPIAPSSFLLRGRERERVVCTSTRSPDRVKTQPSNVRMNVAGPALVAVSQTVTIFLMKAARRRAAALPNPVREQRKILLKETFHTVCHARGYWSCSYERERVESRRSAPPIAIRNPLRLS